MDIFAVVISVAAFAGFVGYKVGFSQGKKVNAPVASGSPSPRPRDRDLDLR